MLQATDLSAASFLRAYFSFCLQQLQAHCVPLHCLQGAECSSC